MKLIRKLYENDDLWLGTSSVPFITYIGRLQSAHSYCIILSKFCMFMF